MWKSVFKVMGTTALFALAHSALASRRAKQYASQLTGERQRNAFYRPLYLAQSAASLGALYLYTRGLPDKVIYHIHPPLSGFMQAARLASVGYAVYAARQVGVGRMLGLPGLKAWLAGELQVPQEPEAQGPRLAAKGELKVTGPFSASRHPLNLAPLPVFWLAPKMTAKLAAFNCVSTLYLVIGSMHEERRLRDAYDHAYEEYQKSGVAFYLPGRTGQRLLSRETREE
jgi:protein-S-isoprenylcysteine O-methyltransferase Ste14